MVGAIIGAAVSAGSALANYLTTKRQNDKLKDELKAEQAAAKSQEVTDRYGNWRYSGANQYFNRAADEVKDYVRQQRGARRVTGAQNTGAEEAAGKTLAQAAGQATAQREAVGLELAAQDRARYQSLRDQERKINAAQSAATTQAWTQMAQAGSTLATALDGKTGSTRSKKGPQYAPGVKEHSSSDIKMREALNQYTADITPANQAGFKNNTGIDFSDMSQTDAMKLLDKIGGL